MTLHEPFDGLVELVRQRYKHLPGQHNQQDHTPKIYGRGVAADMGAGTPVTMEWLSKHPQRNLFLSYYKPEATRLKQALVDGNITQEDMDGLRGFISRPGHDLTLKGYKYDHEGVLRDKRDVPIAGIYYDGYIHVSTRRLYGEPEDLTKVVVHEVGHHKIEHMDWRGAMRTSQASRVIYNEDLKHASYPYLAQAGLRTYSITSGAELLADTFVVTRSGTPEQQAALTDIWGEAGFDNLEDIYKQLAGMVSANELRAVRYDDGTVDLILVPMVVMRDIYEQTPWYYVDARQ